MGLSGRHQASNHSSNRPLVRIASRCLFLSPKRFETCTNKYCQPRLVLGVEFHTNCETNSGRVERDWYKRLISIWWSALSYRDASINANSEQANAMTARVHYNVHPPETQPRYIQNTIQKSKSCENLPHRSLWRYSSKGGVNFFKIKFNKKPKLRSKRVTPPLQS